MKQIPTSLPKIALLGATLLALTGPSIQAQAKKDGGIGLPAIKGVETALGKKLTASQKAQIVSAAKARDKATNDARKKNMQAFRLKLAKIAGVSLAQLEAKEKAARKGKAAPKKK